jgi:hypothetical protein
MAKALFAIVNARHRQDWRDIIRRTWLPLVPKDRADAFFFVGQGSPISDSESVVELQCSDAYKDLPSKVQNICRWALQNGYDHVLKIDDDVVIRPTLFLDSGFQNYDFSGQENRPGKPAVTYGFCYTLSRKSMEAVSRAGLPHDFDDEKWVAQVLYRADIPLTNVSGYSLHQHMNDHAIIQIARCVHLDANHNQGQKLHEFERIFNSPVWTGELPAPVTHPLPARGPVRRYDSTGLKLDWWDSHKRPP